MTVSLYSYKFTLSIVTIAVLVSAFSACGPSPRLNDPKLLRQMQVADSLAVAGNYVLSQKVALSIRHKIQNNSPLLASYYSFQSSLTSRNPAGKNAMTLYADSALALFNTPSQKKLYPNEYRKALLAKGNASIKQQQYIAGLNYYVEAKGIVSNTCNDGEVAEKIGAIYYDQGNYKTAAAYSAERYSLQLLCADRLPKAKRFRILQGILNNTGYAYERAGLPDSALYYYQKDVELINEAERTCSAEPQNINAAKAVVYDNMGGLYAIRGNLKLAEEFLRNSIRLSNSETNATKVTTYIKLASTLTKAGKLIEAQKALSSGHALLMQYPHAPAEFKVRWLKARADYLFKSKMTDQAYTCLSNYLQAKDSLLTTLSDLYRLDVAREIRNLQSQNEIKDLQQKEKFRHLYQIAIVVITALAFVIILLVFRLFKRAERETKETALHNLQLNQTNAELERVNKNYIRIMRVMAHDLRNPLGGISGLAQVMLDEVELNEDSRHMLELIETTSIHSLEMINELLKSDLGDNGPMAKALVDINALLFESAELLQFKAKEKQQVIVYQGAPQPVFITLNYEKMWRVFNNLIVNSLKFSYENDQIDINLIVKDDHVLVTVKDNGIGIPAENKKAVFEMFTSAKRVGTKGEQPFGLGLSISKNIVERHGGSIWFESANPKGTIFFVKLPF